MKMIIKIMCGFVNISLLLAYLAVIFGLSFGIFYQADLYNDQFELTNCNITYYQNNDYRCCGQYLSCDVHCQNGDTGDQLIDKCGMCTTIEMVLGYIVYPSSQVQTGNVTVNCGMDDTQCVSNHNVQSITCYYNINRRTEILLMLPTTDESWTIGIIAIMVLVFILHSGICIIWMIYGKTCTSAKEL